MLKITGKRGNSRRVANSLGRVINRVTFGAPEAQAAASDIYDEEFCGAAAATVIGHIAPGYSLPEEPFFRTVLTGDIFTVETNLDLIRADRYHRRLIPDAQPLAPERILIDIFDAGADLRFSANLSAEMAVSTETSDIAQIRLSQLLNRRHVSNAELAAFQDFVFDDGKAIQQAVNAHHRNFDEVLEVAGKARKFKEWVAGQPDDSNLAKNYLREVSEIDWIDKLPAKSFRWALFNLVPAGLASLGINVPAAATLVTSLSDSFFVDRLARGWKPNQFVEGPVRRFIEASAMNLN